MQYLGVSYEMKHIPQLDPGFIPFGIWMNEYEKGADKDISIAVERNNGFISVRQLLQYRKWRTTIFPSSFEQL